MTTSSRSVVLWVSLVAIAAVISACSQTPEDVLGPATDTPEGAAQAATALPATDAPIPSEPVEVPELIAYSGTPTEICEAATPAEEPETRSFVAAEDVLEPDTDYRAIFCTDAGAIYVDLFETVTPVTVNNFLFLSRIGYYNNTIFHRVLEDFMAQGGDPTATGTGGPGYRFEDEFESYLLFDRPNLLAMANAGPGTNGSQFFITTSEPTHLNFRHTIFGEVLEGQDAVAAIQLRNPEEADAPATTLDTVVIITDPDAVDSTYEAPDASFAAEDFAEGLAELATVMPPNLQEGLSDVEEQSTDDVVAAAPEAVQDDYGTLLADNNHQYRVALDVTDTTCEGNFFEMLTYTVDAFTTVDEATAVRTSDVLDTVYSEEGFSTVEAETSAPYYTQEAESCGEGDTISGRVVLQRGPYLVTLTGTLPGELASDPQFLDNLGELLSENGTRLVEPFLSEIYRTTLTS